MDEFEAQGSELDSSVDATKPSPQRKRGRPKKQKDQQKSPTQHSKSRSPGGVVKRPRGRPKKSDPVATKRDSPSRQRLAMQATKISSPTKHSPTPVRASPLRMTPERTNDKRKRGRPKKDICITMSSSSNQNGKQGTFDEGDKVLEIMKIRKDFQSK